jgi:hypothetical protein
VADIKRIFADMTYTVWDSDLTTSIKTGQKLSKVTRMLKELKITAEECI